MELLKINENFSTRNLQKTFSILSQFIRLRHQYSELITLVSQIYQFDDHCSIPFVIVIQNIVSGNSQKMIKFLFVASIVANTTSRNHRPELSLFQLHHVRNQQVKKKTLLQKKIHYSYASGAIEQQTRRQM